MQIINVTPENAAEFGVGCVKDRKHEGFGRKLAWFKKRYKEGLRLQQIADRYEANVEDVLTSPYNELDEYGPNDVPPWGMHIVVPGGQREIVDWPPAIVSVVDETTGTVGMIQA